MSTSFTLHLSKTKIDDFTICTVYKFDTVYRKNPIYRKFRYDRKTHTDKPILVSIPIYSVISVYRTFLLWTRHCGRWRGKAKPRGNASSVNILQLTWPCLSSDSPCKHEIISFHTWLWLNYYLFPRCSLKWQVLQVLRRKVRKYCTI
jgi:hypothetical protein